MEKQLKSSQKINQCEQIKKVPLSFAVHSISYINEMPELNVEPLYDLTKENISKLNELIETPFLSFDGIEKYPTLEEKAAVIFCVTIRGHKFGNGNKRTAVMLLLVLLYINGKWIAFSWVELYKLAMEIAENTCAKFEMQIDEVAKKLSTRVITLTEALSMTPGA